MIYYQQGDVLLKKVSELPAGAKKLEGKVLQLGEVTGHKHQFAPIKGEEQKVDIYVSPEFAGQEMSITPDEGKFIIVNNIAYLTPGS